MTVSQHFPIADASSLMDLGDGIVAALVARSTHAMIHFSCDRCHQRIDQTEVRYTVNINAEASIGNPVEAGDDAERMQLAELLEGLSELERAEVENDLYRASRFDLCGSCYRRFMANPFGDSAREVEFTTN